MENPTHSFREMNLALHLVYKLQMKSKTVMELKLAKEKKECLFFVTFLLYRENVFNICVLSQCRVHLIKFQNRYTFTYELLYTLLMIVFKIIESLQCIL